MTSEKFLRDMMENYSMASRLDTGAPLAESIVKSILSHIESERTIARMQGNLEGHKEASKINDDHMQRVLNRQHERNGSE